MRSRAESQPEALTQPSANPKTKISSGPITNVGTQMPIIASDIGHVIGGGILAQRRDDARAQSENQRDGQSVAAEFQRDRERRPDQFIDRPRGVLERRPQIAFEQIAHVIEVLLVERFVQPVEGFELLLDFRRNAFFSRERPARREPHHEKRERGDHEEDRNHFQKSFGDETKHGQ